MRMVADNGKTIYAVERVGMFQYCAVVRFIEDQQILWSGERRWTFKSAYRDLVEGLSSDQVEV